MRPTNLACALGLVLVAQAAPLSVSALLNDPHRFHRRAVTVTGTISNFRGNPWRRGGPNYTFDLGDGVATVHVITFVKPPCESGAAMIEGTFAALKGRTPASYSFEEITALNVTCLFDPVDQRGPKAK